MNTTKLPSGLTPGDQSFEIFKKDGEAFSLNNGNTISYWDFPEAIYLVIDTIILLRPKAVWSLNDMGIEGAHERRLQFISCNLANFDFQADISACMSKITTEYVQCGMRGKCKYEGKLCGGILINERLVSVRELRIMALIRIGLMDKEIADKLNISTETLKTTKRTIQQKFQIERKAMIANVAAELQIC